MNDAWLGGIRAIHRFGLTVAIFVGAYIAVPLAAISWISPLVASWDLATLFYLALAWTLIIGSNAATTREHASIEDASRYVIFILIVGAACTSLVAIGFLASEGTANLHGWPRAAHLTMSIYALISSWFLIHTVFTFHYAHRYYDALIAAPRARAPLDFPGEREPDYLDFAYYSFVVGMTSQVSDVVVKTQPLRRLTLLHGVLSFLFNVAVLALAIGIIGSVFAAK